MQLTHLQAWEKIRAAFATYQPTSMFSYPPFGLATTGLCGAVAYLNMEGEISYHLYSHMLTEIKSIAPATHNIGYYWRCNADGARERVKAIDTILGRIKAVVTHLEKQNEKPYPIHHTENIPRGTE